MPQVHLGELSRRDERSRRPAAPGRGGIDRPRPGGAAAPPARPPRAPRGAPPPDGPRPPRGCRGRRLLPRHAASLSASRVGTESRFSLPAISSTTLSVKPLSRIAAMSHRHLRLLRVEGDEPSWCRAMRNWSTKNGLPPVFSWTSCESGSTCSAGAWTASATSAPTWAAESGSRTSSETTAPRFAPRPA